MRRPQWLTIGAAAVLLMLINNLSNPLAQQAQTRVDATNVRPIYANFSRVTGTAEEVIVDVGLNPQAQGTPASVKVESRVVLSFYTAKRLMLALKLAVERHEKAFGPIELDARKRLLQPG